VLMFTRTTLSELLLAIEGTIIMNEELQNAFDSIFDAKVPRKWLRTSWESSTLGFWFTELIDRNKQFSIWIFKARPKSFCLSGFFNPQGFLTAVRQETTRANLEWALDETGVYVHGLYLDGASWDIKKGVVTEAVNKVLYKLMPVIHIFAVNTAPPMSTTMYECPVYKI
ncbi:Dynein axonemal heavy chain 8, partial [Pseudolycoriella hygida]